MYVVWDKVHNRPFSKEKYGHFKIYETKAAAERYHRLFKHRTEVRSVSHIAFTDGGFY